MGGTLAVIDSAAVQSVITTLVRRQSFPFLWVSLRQTRYYWSTGAHTSQAYLYLQFETRKFTSKAEIMF